jgi:vacuolar-type H+-ATPase subunit I/STV1
MEVEKERAVSNPKEFFQRNLFPITIISSILFSGSVGFTASQLVVNNSVGNTTVIRTMKNQVNEARNNSLKVIETELPKIISDLDTYNQDINLLVENVKWLNGNVTEIRDGISKFGSLINVASGVNNIVDIPMGNMITKMDNAQNQLDEIDRILFDLENLNVIKQEMNDSQKKLNVLFKEYQKEKNIQVLFEIEQELNSDLIYQIEDLRNTSIQANNVLELSANVSVSVNKTRSLYNSLKEMGNETLNKLQFWKENEEEYKIETNTKEDLEKDLKKIQKLPNEIAQRSKSSITSISNVQKELQTIKIAQMISSE